MDSQRPVHGATTRISPTRAVLTIERAGATVAMGRDLVSGPRQTDDEAASWRTLSATSRKEASWLWISR